MPPYFRNLREREVRSAYLRLGFRVSGSGRGPHERLTHERLGLIVRIPRHRGVIPLGTVTDLVRKSGITDAEFLMALDEKVPERFR